MSDALDILGFQYPGGYLDYRGGLLVIYGQNGAGKSLLLESIESTLTGHPVGRTKPNFFDYGSLSSAVLVRTSFSRLGFYSEQADGGIIDERFRTALRSADREITGLELPSGLAAAWGDLRREFAGGEFAVLAPAGSSEPRWVAYAATDPNSTNVANWLTELESRLATFGDDISAAYEAWSLTNEVDTEHHFRNFNGFNSDEGPFRFLGVTQTLFKTPFGTVITEQAADPASTVRGWVRAVFEEAVFAGDLLGPDDIRQRLEVTANGWTARANELMRMFLIDPPVLCLVLGGPLNWVSGQEPRWEASTGVSIGRLSDAERRWSRIAIALAAPDNDTASWVGGGTDRDTASAFAIDRDSQLPAPILLLDEPERGLHRSAEAHLAAGLLKLDATDRVKLILATHSPALLDARQGQVVHLAKVRDRGIGAMKQLTGSQIDELRSVGLQPSSLLDRPRGYLLVEGEHDKQILEGWFAEELRSLRVTVLRMHGTKNLTNVFDSEFLIEGTDATLMPLLDDIACGPLIELWASAEAAILGGHPHSRAASIVHHGIKKVPGGAKHVYEPLLTGTIRRGISNRFFPLGMAKKDVLEYLPVGALVEGASSWAQLREEWKTSTASIADRSGAGYKAWLKKSKGADLSPENLRLTAETTAPHPELKALIATISERLDDANATTPQSGALHEHG